MYLGQTAKAMMAVPDPAVFDVKQLAAIRIGKKIGPIPSEVKQAGVVSTWL